MLAWEWALEKARDGEGEVEKKAAPRKISQTAQVQKREMTKHSMFLTLLDAEGGWVRHILYFADLEATTHNNM